MEQAIYSSDGESGVSNGVENETLGLSLALSKPSIAPSGPIGDDLMIELSVIIVSWNCRNHLHECLMSLRENLQDPADIIVVDNASTDGTVEMLERHFPEVRVIQNQHNLGFAKANNIGISASRGRYLALINPDVKLLSGCLESALATVKAQPSIGVLGPAMIGRDGTIRRSGMRFPTLWNCVCDALMLHRLFGRRPIVGGQSMADFDWTTTRDVEVLNGWFWLIRRSALSEVGLLDERFFMYGEDMDWCKRFYDSGWRIVFAPEAAAIHYGGGSAEQAPMRFYLEMQKANLQYWTKHHNRITRPLYVSVLFFHHLVRLVGYRWRHVTGRDDAEARTKVALYAACLKQLLSGRIDP
jgi:GT2 family glycosyltransferase